MSDSMYREELLDQYWNPHHHGTLPKPTVSHEDYNPLCGDRIRFDVLLDDTGKITDVRFSGEGCAISQAASSMLTDKLLGLSAHDAAALTQEDMFAMLGITISPARTNCALLGYAVMKKALESKN